MKTGIMGGTFDPPHYAHLILAEQAREQFGLDRMLFMPNGAPPHKANRAGRADNGQRLRMCALAVADNPHLELCDLEMKREGPSYTWQTLQELHGLYPHDDFYFIIGADSLQDFPTWRKPQKICDQCTLLCAVRNDRSREEMEAAMDRVRALYGAQVHLLETPNMDISSSMIREMVGAERSVRYYLPETVRTYIEEEQLYR